MPGALQKIPAVLKHLQQPKDYGLVWKDDSLSQAEDILNTMEEHNPELIDQYQTKALGDVLNTKIFGDSELAVIDPNNFEDLALPLSVAGDLQDVPSLYSIGALGSILKGEIPQETYTLPSGVQIGNQGHYRQYYNPDHPVQGEFLEDPGFSSVPHLRLGISPYLGDLRVLSHEGRHRNRALAQQGREDSLVELVPDRHTEAEKIATLLQEPKSYISGERNLAPGGHVGRLIKRLLSIGGLGVIASGAMEEAP